MAPDMRLTLWVSDDLGQWAKDRDVNLSGTLRAALEELRQSEPGEHIEPGVIHAGDSLLIDIEAADGIETSAPKVRITVAALRRWVALLDRGKPKRPRAKS